MGPYKITIGSKGRLLKVAVQQQMGGRAMLSLVGLLKFCAEGGRAIHA